jgi:TonB family protein
MNHPILRLGIVAGLYLAAGAVPGFALDRAPLPTFKAEPVYPNKLRHIGDGKVVADFVVDTQGSVRDVRLVSCSCPEAEESVVDALLRWRFYPGMDRGRPVNTRMEIPIDFCLGDEHEPRILSWSIDPKAAPGAPPEFQYDQPPVLKLTLPAVYPRNLLEKGIEGSATIAFAVDPTGRPRHLVVIEASEPEFGAAAVAMMASWRMYPAKKGPVPCWAAVRMTQKFNKWDEDVSADDHVSDVVDALAEKPCPIVANPRLLDALPLLRYHPACEIPDEVVKAGAPASAVVEVVIDRYGHAQVPSVVIATNDALGWAAATAAGRWQFTVPMKNGKPVEVFARIPFVFNPPCVE